ncbi:MAG: ATP-binding cassette domain-containing protein, partial [Kineosporiaceae bacterium]
LAPDLCRAYLDVASTGRATAQMLDLLAASSPARVLPRISAPALIVQGEADSLFPLGEGDANAAGIAATGTPVKVVWTGGGHDGGPDERDRLRALTLAWFDHHLRGVGAADTRFEATVGAAAISSADSNPEPLIRVAPAAPGVNAGAGAVVRQRIPLHGAEQGIVSPAGGWPAAVTALPGAGIGGLSVSAVGGSLASPPGQVATFDSEPLTSTVRLVGAGSVRLRVWSSTPEATLFVSLQDVSPYGPVRLPGGLVSPVRVGAVPAGGSEITVQLPAVVRDIATGHRLRVAVSATDQAYALPVDARRYRVALAEGDVVVPTVAMAVLDAGGLTRLLPWALGLLVAAGLVAGAARWRGRRVAQLAPSAELAEVPLAVTGLGKTYPNGFRAVRDVSMRVEQGWVLGLLGPNGAGKTTVLRMLMGLIRPGEGEIRVFGHLVTPGAPVLSRVGSFVEGPGFLPHVSGLDNLRLFWASTGRPGEQARFDEALEVAGLGEDVHRTVRTYSQGMRQRLAIAQAMLGLPDLLVLDEPTNGLDPPQIREMREVLTRYAATGRTVVVSSHLLAEVEQTCSHVVVMHQGSVVAAGVVADLVGSATALVVDVDDPARAAAVAQSVPGARAVSITAAGLTLELIGTPRSA